MYLLIDPSVQDQFTLAFFDEKQLVTKTVEAKNRVLLQCVDNFLREQQKDAHAVRGIMVVIGEGGFSSTRAAVTLANTFAYALRIPILAASKEDVIDPQKKITELIKRAPGQYIAPTYSGEPNITKKKT